MRKSLLSSRESIMHPTTNSKLWWRIVTQINVLKSIRFIKLIVVLQVHKLWCIPQSLHATIIPIEQMIQKLKCEKSLPFFFSFLFCYTCDKKKKDAKDISWNWSRIGLINEIIESSQISKQLLICSVMKDAMLCILHLLSFYVFPV